MTGSKRPRASRILVASLLGCACAACTLGPDYARPTIETPDSFRFSEYAADKRPAAELAEVSAWWLGFNDPQLDALVREGLVNNRNLHVAVARVDEFAARVASTRAQRFPVVGYATQGTEQDPLSDSYAALLSASWEADLWGRIRRETEAARADLLATEQARRGVALTVVASVVTGYITLLDLDRQLQISEETLKTREKSVKIFRQRFEGGVISDFEMQQVLAEHEIAVSAIPVAKLAIAVQEDALCVLLGRNPGPIARAKALEDLALPAVPSGIPAELLERRPDLLQAEQQLVAANARIGVARALYYPNISLTGVAGSASTDLDNLFSGPARTWSFVGQLLGPIFAGGAIKAANAQAEARSAQALATYEGVIQDSFRDVEDGLAAVATTRAVQASSERRTASLRQARYLSNERYENGYSDYLELLDTERSLFSAELQLSSARGDSYRSLVNLYRALGGDWAAVDPAAQRPLAESAEESP